MDGPMGQDRRVLERFSIKAVAIVRTAAANNGDSFNLITRDISSGGAFFLMTVPLTVGEKVNVTIYLSIAALEGVSEEPSRTQIVTDGQVVRTEEAGVAVRFSGHYSMAPAPV